MRSLKSWLSMPMSRTIRATTPIGAKSYRGERSQSPTSPSTSWSRSGAAVPKIFLTSGLTPTFCRPSDIADHKLKEYRHDSTADPTHHRSVPAVCGHHSGGAPTDLDRKSVVEGKGGG